MGWVVRSGMPDQFALERLSLHAPSRHGGWVDAGKKTAPKGRPRGNARVPAILHASVGERHSGIGPPQAVVAGVEVGPRRWRKD